MSRTYRTHLEWKWIAYGKYWTWREKNNFCEVVGVRAYEMLGWKGRYYVDKHCRDSKAWDKPSKAFKQMKRRCERSRMKAALDAGKDLPRFCTSDQWDWT
jgi:hypothetical protein